VHVAKFKATTLTIVIILAGVASLGEALLTKNYTIFSYGTVTTEGFLFMDTYEDNPTIIKVTPQLWLKLTEDSRAGDYWCDQVHWLEIGYMDENGTYKIDNPNLGDAKVTTYVARKGTRSVESTIFEVPSGCVEAQTCIARYFRNQSIVKDGVYEVGAWFYVPKGYTPYYVHISMENHLSWMRGYFIHIGVNPESSELVVATRRFPECEVIDKVNFQYDTWFKLWIVYNTKELIKYTAGYKSPIEEKTFELDKAYIAGPDPSYYGLPAFNFYATGHNLLGRAEQKLYVDDFYAKVVG